MRHRKASDVAAELGLTRSGVSQALKRLRDIFGDPLFLRRPHGMAPTLPALAAASATGALVTLPSRIAPSFAPAFGLEVAMPPNAVRSFTIPTTSTLWHRRSDGDPRLGWLLSQSGAVSRPL